ncbi:ArsR family transcriptional regulator [Clostridium sp. AF19-22AC]|jgi:DNA-binding transcriptional ArsR family regulator|uniref:ArsR/SmtB family transcription factor n=1 Tax=Clostridia TaxID=186801 RepID=UPI000E521BC4|nr:MULTISPECIES: metalloregulator ArsR/SmtB family transcription factor [Clostridia]RHR31954.1 ArsR family transcriptional regulator [Clostridium sp. AF19-22AC]
MSKKTMFYMKECAPIFSMLQDERRQEITQLLFENRELSVSSLTEKLSLSRPAVSHHLKLLLDTGLVTVRQEGKERYYQLNLKTALDQLKNLTASIEKDIEQMK